MKTKGELDFAVRTPGMTDCSLALFDSYLRITFD